MGNERSALPCGCDAGANYICQWHRDQQVMLDSNKATSSDPRFWSAGSGEVRVVDPNTGGEKGQKPCQMGALDPRSLVEVGKVAGFGAKKYARYNFAKGYAWSLSYDAIQRHLMAFWDGENFDAESGLPHIAHAGWHCLTLLTFMLRKRGTDDRFPQEIK